MQKDEANAKSLNTKFDVQLETGNMGRLNQSDQNAFIRGDLK